MIRNPNWPTGLLASAYWPTHDLQKHTMAICIGYFEAHQSGERVFTVAGYVASKARWRFLDERWPRALRAEGLSSFNGQQFVRGSGGFSTGWVDNEARRSRLLASLARVTQQHVLGGFSCSVRLDDYEALNRERRFAETVSGPYGICAACVMVRVQEWMAKHHPDDLTLAVFEEGDVDHREIRRILKAEGLNRGEPAQVWPRQWVDERGRQRFLRPFEACDLLIPACGSGMADLLSRRAAWEQELVGRDHLQRICDVLEVARRPKSGAGEANL